jgi:hypothetical protein
MIDEIPAVFDPINLANPQHNIKTALDHHIPDSDNHTNK